MLVRELNCSAKTGGGGTRILRGSTAPFAPLPLVTALAVTIRSVAKNLMLQANFMALCFTEQ